MNVLILYHGNCIDGLVAGWISWLSHTLDADQSEPRDEITAIGVHHGQPMPIETFRGHKPEYIEIVDFCYAPGDLQRLSEIEFVDGIQVLDHHASARDMMQGYSLDRDRFNIEFDMNRSGAKLAFDEHVGTFVTYMNDDGDVTYQPPRAFAFPQHIPFQMIKKLADYVDDRDRWVFKLPKSKAINRVLGLRIGNTMEEFNLYLSDVYRAYRLKWEEKLAEHGQILLDADEARIEAAVKLAWEVSLETSDGFITVPCTNVYVDIVSETLHRLASKHPSGAAMGFYLDGPQAHFSLRSRKDGPDVAKIATFHRGGGHPNASGFRVNMYELADVIAPIQEE